VQCATEEDEFKLLRVLKYLNGTKVMGIVLDATKGIGVIAFIDAAYGVHSDYISHTGAVISLGSSGRVIF